MHPSPNRFPKFLKARYLVVMAITLALTSITCLRIFASPEDESPGESQSQAKPNPVGDIPLKDGPTEKEYPALHNLLQVTEDYYSGAEPHTDEAFASLARLGIKTIVSVDGAKPNLEAARKHGLRYIHIPIGYSGINEDAGLSFARLAKEVDGPIYFHCHHGRHRGPAAVAAACVAAGRTDGKGALAILERAGTNKGYAGLWRDVENYKPPAEGIELPKLVETAEVDSFAAAMAQVDRAYDNLKLCQDAGWKTPSNHPDLVPAQEALLLKEGLHESGRNLAEEYNDEFRNWLKESEALAIGLEESLKKAEADLIPGRFDALRLSCVQCHKKYRD